MWKRVFVFVLSIRRVELTASRSHNHSPHYSIFLLRVHAKIAACYTLIAP